MHIVYTTPSICLHEWHTRHVRTNIPHVYGPLSLYILPSATKTLLLSFCNSPSFCTQCLTGERSDKMRGGQRGTKTTCQWSKLGWHCCCCWRKRSTLHLRTEVSRLHCDAHVDVDVALDDCLTTYLVQGI